jgi:hypothetical protein
MSKVSIGEKVDNVAGDEGAIIAVFPTVDGNFIFVKDMKEYDALEFTEDRLVVHPVRPVSE